VLGYEQQRVTGSAIMTISGDLKLSTTIAYPEEDEQPMPEGDKQRDYLSYATKALRIFFRDRPDVYVSGNLFIYYQKGDNKKFVAPDTFVVFGAGNHDRGSYKVWEEGGKVPDFVLEITSEGTVSKDRRDKPALYSSLGVREYFQYDPTGKFLQPVSLLGMRLEDGKYADIAPLILENGVLTLYSETLQLELQLLEKGLRFCDPKTGEYLRTHEEAEARARYLADRLRALGINPDEVQD
jgi:Uma2 family endonuclease